MRRLSIAAAVIAVALLPGAAVAATSTPGPSVATVRLVAFRGFHLGGGGFRRPTGFFGSRGFGRRTSVLHRVARALAFAYLLHLFFTHGGLSIILWLLIIGLAVHFLRRRRRLRDRYSY